MDKHLMENPAHRDRLASLLDAVELEPTNVVLPSSGRMVEVLTLLRRERLWAGPVPTSFASVPNKPALQYGDKPIWAEFALLRLLERGDWQGVWVKNWGGRSFWRGVLDAVELPCAVASLFSRIEARVGRGGGGCWDVLAWRGDGTLSSRPSGGEPPPLAVVAPIWCSEAVTQAQPSFMLGE